MARARRLRKAVGGGMRQAGVVAAGGLAALAEQVGHGSGVCHRSGCTAAESPTPTSSLQTPRLLGDHARASALAAGLRAIPGIAAPAHVDTNIVYFSLVAAREDGDAGLSLKRWHERVAAARAAGLGVVVDAPSGAAVRLEAVPPEGETSLAAAFAGILHEAANVRVGALGGCRLRAVTHHQVGWTG